MGRSESKKRTTCFFCESPLPAGPTRIDRFGNRIGPCCAHLIDDDD
jgi:hypothetical protein